MKKVKIMATVGIMSTLVLVVGCGNNINRFTINENNSPLMIQLKKGDTLKMNRKILFSSSQDTNRIFLPSTISGNTGGIQKKYWEQGIKIGKDERKKKREGEGKAGWFIHNSDLHTNWIGFPIENVHHTGKACLKL